MDKDIHIFYACDERYIPCLSVSLLSLLEHRTPGYRYHIGILHSGIPKKNRHPIADLADDRADICFYDVSRQLKTIAHQLSLRDYYSLSIYYRLFIPKLFPALDKAVYLDADTVLLADVARLYNTPLDEHLVAAVPDGVVASEDTFIRYAEQAVGISYNAYFNSGVMVMNLQEMRRQGLQEQFTRLLSDYGFATICPDQDYLNVLCKGQVRYLGKEWNTMSVEKIPKEPPCLVHYNMFFKPWLYDDVPYQEYFWAVAPRSPFYGALQKAKASFGAPQRQADALAGEQLRRSAEDIIRHPGNFKAILGG